VLILASAAALPYDFSVMAKSQTQRKTGASGLTPMMAQYTEVKEQYPDCLLFYRMGDFYEMFFDDAVTAAAALDITLTKRGHAGDGGDIPMCGVPWHSYETYLERLIRKGYKVAICEQVETPEEAKKRGGYKALVRREVVRVVTQGTLTEDSLLERDRNNYLCALARTGQEFGLAWLDMSTGAFMMQPLAKENIAAALQRLSAGEILIPDRLAQDSAFFDLWAEYKKCLTIQPDSRFDAENAAARLKDMFGVATLESFGGFCRAEIAAAGALVDYAELTQKGRLPRIAPPRQLPPGSFMEIDAATRRNLELTHNLQGGRDGSLLSVIDKTVTGGGARLLASRLSMPLTDAEKISRRLDLVAFFAENGNIRAELRAVLKHCPDMERALSRLSVGRGSPRDLASVYHSINRSGTLQKILGKTAESSGGDLFSGTGGLIPAELEELLNILKRWGGFHPLADKLGRALLPDLPVLARDGGFIAPGFSPQLDEYRMLKEDGRKLVAQLQAQYVKKTGINALKIKHNNVLGYFIDVPAAHADKLLKNDGPFVHRQTLANNVRFTTVELTGLEQKIMEAGEKSLALELELFAALVSDVLALAESIAELATALARLDVAAALAELAITENYTRPVVDSSLSFTIEKGRHPVVEQGEAVRRENGFIANDCALTEDDRLWLLTGPNMAGKSTFLRQNALIVLLAQTGSFVPAESVHIGIVDRIFSRVGAADDLARGRSTFMVEMVETATILNQATERSFVILDEIGRGTSTFDGLSIAWAVTEYLHDVKKCRTLFATHYHELTGLQDRLDKISCHTVRVREWQDKIVFLHEVVKGAADRSYGIHVAKLAGLPADVVGRAGEVLQILESGEQAGILKEVGGALPVFAPHSASNPAPETEKTDPQITEILAEIDKIDPDTLTPRAALDILYRLAAIRAEK